VAFVLNAETWKTMYGNQSQLLYVQEICGQLWLYGRILKNIISEEEKCYLEV